MTDPHADLARDIADTQAAILQTIEEIEIRLGWLKKDFTNYKKLQELL